MEHFLVVADDDLSNRYLMKGFLKDTSLRILDAKNGNEALELCRIHHPDVLLMDLKMPEKSGWETAREIRNDPELKAMPLVAMTAGDLEEDVGLVRDNGLWNAVLCKPFTKRNLLDILSQILPFLDDSSDTA